MPENNQTIQEWRGVRNLVAAEVLVDTEEEFSCDTPFYIAGVAEISRTTDASSEAHYYDNRPAVIISGNASDEVTASVSAIPFDVTAKITGQDYDPETGMFVEGERANKYFALGYITEKTDGTEVFVWRLKGQFSIPDNTHTTKDDGTDANGQEVTFTGVNTNHKFTIGDKKKTAKAINVDTSINAISEETFFASVQTPDTIADVATV